LCFFFSNKLSSAERNYDIGDQELLAVKLAFEEWLEGTKEPFVFLTDHRNLHIDSDETESAPNQVGTFLHQVRLHADLSPMF
jgi:hypothetical protein